MLLISDKKLIGSKIKLLRIGLGFTKAEVALRAGVSFSTYIYIEKGIIDMRLNAFVKICKALNATPDEILNESKSERSRKIEILKKLNGCESQTQREIAELISFYLQTFG